MWDQENRLVEMRAASPAEGSVKLVFVYDYMNRRIRRQAFTYDATAEAWRTAAESDVRFIYDGWNVILELDALDDDAVIRKYTWGLDLSGTRQGAGGIGGLLAVEDANGTPSNPDDDLKYLYFHDANGNVGQLIGWRPIEDWETLGMAHANAWHPSRLAARYEYDPYGNALLDPTDSEEGGPYASANPFRFSTKYCEGGLDPASTAADLYYYGHRYYRPDIGRWMNRDPIEELGTSSVQQQETLWESLSNLGTVSGITGNEFLFSMNAPVDCIDPVGLDVLGWIANNRMSQWIVCMSDCMDDNDPAQHAIDRLVSLITGQPIPKSIVARLAELAGDHELAEAIRRTRGSFVGQSRFTTIPSTLAHKLRNLTGPTAKRALRAFGRYAAPVSVSYGLALAAVQAHCAGWCCGAEDYDAAAGNIVKEMKRRFLNH